MRALVEGQTNGELAPNGGEGSSAAAEGELTVGANGSDGFEAEGRSDQPQADEVRSALEPAPKPAPEAD